MENIENCHTRKTIDQLIPRNALIPTTTHLETRIRETFQERDQPDFEYNNLRPIDPSPIMGKKFNKEGGRTNRPKFLKADLKKKEHYVVGNSDKGPSRIPIQ